MRLIGGLFAALRFLTILPVPGKIGSGERDLARSGWFFPVVGALAGAAVGAAAWAMGLIAPVPLTAAATVVLMIVVSGGLHADGLSDSADGMLSCRDRTRMLEIMRDSRIGAMGVLAIASVMLLKFGALASVEYRTAAIAAGLAVLAGRCAMVPMLCLLPYARPEGGLASALLAGLTPAEKWARSIWALAAMSAAGFFLAGFAGLIAMGAAVIVAACFCAFCMARIGGCTGDTYGAACELSETACMIAFALPFNRLTGWSIFG